MYVCTVCASGASDLVLFHLQNVFFRISISSVHRILKRPLNSFQVNLIKTKTKQTNICLRMAARLGFLFLGFKVVVRGGADSESGRLQTLGVLLNYLLVRHGHWKDKQRNTCTLSEKLKIKRIYLQ